MSIQVEGCGNSTLSSLYVYCPMSKALRFINSSFCFKYRNKGRSCQVFRRKQLLTPPPELNNNRTYDRDSTVSRGIKKQLPRSQDSSRPSRGRCPRALRSPAPLAKSGNRSPLSPAQMTLVVGVSSSMAIHFPPFMKLIDLRLPRNP